ncbi:hypothetical protein DL93DRAFT_2233074 [Clavulina sp. PMI_390]|nr:hypothetical protein DL93DRAFT_2233074 [Clavulina sp. PMI_390]
MDELRDPANQDDQLNSPTNHGYLKTLIAMLEKRLETSHPSTSINPSPILGDGYRFDPTPGVSSLASKISEIEQEKNALSRFLANVEAEHREWTIAHSRAANAQQPINLLPDTVIESILC